MSIFGLLKKVFTISRPLPTVTLEAQDVIRSILHNVLIISEQRANKLINNWCDNSSLLLNESFVVEQQHDCFVRSRVTISPLGNVTLILTGDNQAVKHQIVVFFDHTNKDSQHPILVNAG